MNLFFELMFSFSETATQAQSSPWFEHILSKRHQEYLQICVYYFSEKLNFSTHNHYKWKYCKSALSCYKEKLWNHIEWTYFWRVIIIWDLCVAAVAVPPPRSSCCCYSLWGRRRTVRRRPPFRSQRRAASLCTGKRSPKPSWPAKSNTYNSTVQKRGAKHAGFPFSSSNTMTEIYTFCSKLMI